MERVLRFLEKYIIPKFIYRFFQPAYHFTLAFFSALVYGFPSEKMTVIGVTGTKGKTTTCNLIAQILNFAGMKIGMATTVNFRIGEREWVNVTKQTMLGRFQLQKLLREMRRNNCKYAIVETSSEGILQYRHRFIDYDIVVFTNISPEHIERHGSFENYRAAKVKLFGQVAKKKNGVGVYNLDDKDAEYFLKPKVKNKYGYRLKSNVESGKLKVDHEFLVSDYKLYPTKTEFRANNEKFEMPLIGEFNIYNAAAAICVALSENIPMEKIKAALETVKSVSGRFEVVDKGQDFAVIIDYAHEPLSLESVYKNIINSGIKAKNRRLICLLGAQGGGRDKWKRATMGLIAGTYCDKIVLANEDPYDEEPSQILSDIKSGISNSKFLISNLYEILDRKEAIKKAIFLAMTGDAVILTGKGGEVWMCMANNKKIPWNEREIVESVLEK